MRTTDRAENVWRFIASVKQANNNGRLAVLIRRGKVEGSDGNVIIVSFLDDAWLSRAQENRREIVKAIRELNGQFLDIVMYTKKSETERSVTVK